ncbi:hypothetical protein AB1E18_019144 [Capra hircus]
MQVRQKLGTETGRVCTSSGRARRLRKPGFPAGAAGVLPRPPPLAALGGLRLRASPSGGAVLLAAGLPAPSYPANCTQAPNSARRLTEPSEEVRPRTSPGGGGGAAVGAGARARPAVSPAASVKGALLSLVTRSLARSRAGCGRSRRRKLGASDAERQRMELLREGTSLTSPAS